MDVLTVLESLFLLIIVGLLIMSVAPKLRPNSHRLAGAAEILRTHIRYAQIHAQSCRKQLGLTSSDNIEYFMFHDAPSQKIPLPGGEKIYQLKDSITISDFVLSFDDSGKPCSDPSGTIPLTKNLVITLQDGGESESVVVMANSGFVT